MSDTTIDPRSPGGVRALRHAARRDVVLFARDPRAAQAAAEALGRTLLRVDLSSIVSKYIGETEKYLEQVLRRAGPPPVLFFFDQADALFGEPAEAADRHDRFANLEVSALLARVAAHGGIAAFAASVPATPPGALLDRPLVAVV